MDVSGTAFTAVAAVLVLAACGAAEPPTPSSSDEAVAPTTPLGLMTTLPIYWPESSSVGELVRQNTRVPRVRAALEERFTLKPLDVLDETSLEGLDQLMLAQPRPLSPQENVALDAWVREGGRLLLFADPMLTSHSRFALGDRRRPQDVVLLSPILSHWGLDLLFDSNQSAGEAVLSLDASEIPVNEPGRLRVRPEASCETDLDAILVDCRIGKGRVVVLADAAVLDEPYELTPKAHDEALAALTRRAFR